MKIKFLISAEEHLEDIYNIIYYMEIKTIYIAAIWDCRQDPNTNKRKIK